MEGVRRNRLKLLISEYEDQEKLAAVLDYTPSYISQLATGYRPITEKTARKIEIATKKPAFWMDLKSPETLDLIFDEKLVSDLAELAEDDPQQTEHLARLLRSWIDSVKKPPS